MLLRQTCIALTAFSLGGCVGENVKRAARGPAVELNESQTKLYRTEATGVIAELSRIANVTPNGTATDESYARVAAAGFLVIDAACADYLEALFWLDRGKSHSIAQLGIFNTAATGALGLFGVGAETIAAVGGAFGLTTSSVANLSDSLLYQLEPSAVRELVRKTQGVFKDTITTDEITDQVAALWHIAAYAELCKPPAIESEVLRAIATTETPAAKSKFAGSPPIVGLTDKQIEYKGITDQQDAIVRDEIQKRLTKDRAAVVAAAEALIEAQNIETRASDGMSRLFELLTDGDRHKFRRDLLEALEAS